MIASHGRRLFLLTGPIGAGKTTALCAFAELAARAGLCLGGILTPARKDHLGAKEGIEALDLLTGERRDLARRSAPDQLATVGHWWFDQEVMAWAVQRALQALHRPCAVVLVDEIGPLELDKGRGFYPVLQQLPRAPSPTVVLVVRDGLAVRLQSHLAGLKPQFLALSKANRDRMPGQLLLAIQGDAGRG